MPTEPIDDRPAEEPTLMRTMAHTLGVDGMLSGEVRHAAAERCADCADKEECTHWLDLAAIRGADQAPGFCPNRDVFADLATEAPATL